MALTTWFAPVPLRALVPSARISLAASSKPPSIASARIGSSWCMRPRISAITALIATMSALSASAFRSLFGKVSILAMLHPRAA
jgi:hypothetical protein